MIVSNDRNIHLLQLLDTFKQNLLEEKGVVNMLCNFWCQVSLGFYISAAVSLISALCPLFIYRLYKVEMEHTETGIGITIFQHLLLASLSFVIFMKIKFLCIS